MPIIVELAFYLLMDVVLYGVGRWTIIALSFGRVRPSRLRDIWSTRTDRGRAMGLYYESVAVNLVGMAVLAAIVALCLFLGSR
jgi:hypothetical protein